ncbi:MAG: transglycosylase SLT domain-containing protein [Bauldia sp.]
MRTAFRNALFLLALLSTPAAIAAKPPYSQIIATHAKANGIPLDLAHAVVRHESGYNAKATGQAGEVGLMQIKYATARGIGYRGSRQALYDPETNIRWGMKYLGEAQRLAGGSECGTLSRYNGGLGRKGMITSYCNRVLARR